MPDVLRVILIIASLGVAPILKAAEIQASSNSQCRVELSGTIVKGDAEALQALSDHLIVHNGESTAGSVLCLDSPGGNALEGLEIARFILENGVSTRIRAGDTCASMCAIAFMMGNYAGAEVWGVGRYMHSTAKLGFHRPYISIDDVRVYTAENLESVYDLGMTTIFNILEFANRREPWGSKRIIEADLMQRILGTRAEEMFYVNTIEEVLRWNIEIDDAPETFEARRNGLFYACENALARPIALTSELAVSGFGIRVSSPGPSVLGDAVFGFSPSAGGSVGRVSSSIEREGVRYLVSSLRAGYAGVGCELELPERGNFLRVCGLDQATGRRLGDCNDLKGMKTIPRLAMLHPRTEIAVLGLPDLPQGDAHRYVSCMVLDADQMPVDRETCLQSVTLLVEDGQPLARHILTWPSGARTVIDVEAEEYDNPDPEVWINGSLGRRVDRIEKSDCILNTNSGNTLCLTP